MGSGIYLAFEHNWTTLPFRTLVPLSPVHFILKRRQYLFHLFGHLKRREVDIISVVSFTFGGKKTDAKKANILRAVQNLLLEVSPSD